MAQTFGVASIVWSGKTYQTKRGSKIKLSGYAQKAVVTGNTVDYSTEYMAGEVNVTLHYKRGDRLSDWLPSGEGELQVKCDTGQSFTMPRAFLTDPPEATGGDGDFARKWQFGEYEEILNG